MHGAPSCWVWHALCTGHSDARYNQVLGLGSLVPWHPDAGCTPTQSLGSLLARGSSLNCFGILDAWGTLMHGVLNLGCLMFWGVPNAGELSLFLAWGGYCVSCCTPVRGPGVPKCGVPLWGCAAPSIAKLQELPPRPLSPALPCLCPCSRQLLCSPTPAHRLGAPALCAALFPPLSHF